MPAFRARYIFPVSAPPLCDAVLSCDHVIRAVGENTSGEEVVDLGNVALVPGLVNAHAHLELSHFDAPIGNPTQGFPAWIRSVVEWRRAQAASLSPEQIAEQREEAIQRGLVESTSAGVIAIADIASPGPSPDQPLPFPLRMIFHEVLGLATNREQGLFQAADDWTRRRLGIEAISPHAPYTVGVDLLARLARLSAERKFPLAMHLAESPDELELLRSHSGSFYALLSDLGAWDPSAFPRGIAILDYLKILATAERALVIHGNYLSREEIDFLAERSDRMSVVYCPRTHAYFGHPKYPLVEMLERGVSMALGTDSRASNPDLNMWNELRYVADHYPELSLEWILHLGTLAGAQAMGLPWMGELVPGALAAFSIIELPDEEAADPHELLFDARSRVLRMYRPALP